MIIAVIALLSLAIVFLSPLFGLICLILSFPFDETIVASGITVSTPIGLAFGLSWFIHHYKNIRIRWDNQYWLFIALIFISLISFLVFDARHHATGNILDLNIKAILQVCIMAFLVHQIIDSTNRIRRLIVAVGISLLIGGFFNMYLTFSLGLDYKADDIHRAEYFFDPNFFSIFCVAFTPVLLSMFFVEKRPVINKSLILILILNAGMAFILSSSRGGFVAAIAVLAMFIYYRGIKYKGTAFLLLIVTGVGGYIGARYLLEYSQLYDLTSFSIYKSATAQDQEIARFAQLLDFSNYLNFTFMGRIEAWIAGLRMLMDHFFLGVGVGQFRIYSQEYAIDFSNYTIRNMVAHNSYIEMMAETGILGGSIFLSIMYLTVRNFKKAFTNDHLQISSRDRALFFALYIGSAGFMVGQFFVSAQINKYLWLIVGLSIASKNIVARKCTLMR